jgi:hypothetical protein
VCKTALFFALFLAAVVPPLQADEDTRNRLIRFFGGWYCLFPDTAILVKETTAVEIPGFEAYLFETYLRGKLSPAPAAKSAS